MGCTWYAGIRGRQETEMGLCLHEIPKVPFYQQKTIPLSLVQNETYRREVAVHVARLLAALHPHSTPHPPSQLGPCTGSLHPGPCTRVPASVHQPWVQRGRVQEQPAKDMSLRQLELAWEEGTGRNPRDSKKPTEANPSASALVPHPDPHSANPPCLFRDQQTPSNH